jgi:hypothetical protein
MTMHSLNDSGIISNSNTSFQKINDSNISLYERKKITEGKIFVRNNLYNVTGNIVESLSSIFLKYPVDVKNEVEDSVISFFVINNIFVIETENYVISDAYLYDIETNAFKNINSYPFYKRKNEISPYLNVFVNPWYDEKNERMFLVFLKTENNSLSSSNYKYVSPEIYSTSIKKINYKKIYPIKDTSTSVYSLSNSTSKIPEINLNQFVGGSFKKNPVLDEYDFTYMVRNMNGLPFIVNEKLNYKLEKDTFVSRNPVLLKPFYYVFDNNYANPTMQYDVRGLSKTSGFIGGRDIYYLNVVGQVDNKINYTFVSNNEPFQINNIGKYIVQLDWSSYDNVNVFVGCSAINLKEVGKNILINFNSNYISLSSANESRNIFNFQKNGIFIDVNVERPNYPDSDIIIFDILPRTNDIVSGVFCNDILGS